MRLILFILIVGSLPALAQVSSQHQDFSIETLHQADNVVWGFDFLSDHEIVYSQRSGEIGYLNLETGSSRILEGTPEVAAVQQGGMLDIKVIRIDENDWVYMTYSESSPAGMVTSLGRAQWRDGQLLGFTRLFQADNPGGRGLHFGSRIVQDDEGYLFMTLGERIERHEAQNLQNHKGTILRLTLDGQAAPQNPFVGEGRPEIWSYGHRNPQGIDFHPVSGALYAVEFGPQGGDELNLIEPGNNYGWPEITYGREYSGNIINNGRTHAPGMEQPVAWWVPSISPSGMAFYTGGELTGWRNDLFIANLASTHLRRLRIDTTGEVVEQEVLLKDAGERFRHVRTGPDGLLYLSTDGGKIMRLSPASS